MICHNNLIGAHRMQALLRHVDNDDADEAGAVTVGLTASARNVAHKCNMECLIAYDVVNIIVAEACVP